MQFKQPEILYFLFALVLPILVHLFQLRRFKTAYFTNVRFLKDISTQTRKSATLKKWLLLAARLLILACLILAFAQPFFPSESSASKQAETYLILDNSYSMQAKGKQGELLKRSVEEVLAQLPDTQEFSLITATETYWNVTTKSIRKELQHLSYSAIPFELDRALAQINARPSAQKKNILLVTDGVNVQSKSLEQTNKENNLFVVIPRAEQKNNASIDTVFVKNQSNEFYEIEVRLRQFGNDKKAIPIALYNENKVVAKTIIQLNSTPKSAVFTLPKKEFNGYVSITDKGLAYDNSLYFSLAKTKSIPVLSIGDPAKCGFLKRIYTANEFRYTNQALAQLDYNELDKNKVIICNELTKIPQALQTSLKAFASAGGTLIIIPSDQVDSDYSQFLQQLGEFKISTLQQGEQLITQIAFAHPVYKSAFEKTISNFDYPKTKSNYVLTARFPKVLSYANQNPFLVAAPIGNSTVYVFTAALNTTNSNFQQSPLIVPTFYAMAELNQQTNQAFYTIGSAKDILIDKALEKEAILTIKNGRDQFIPMQQLIGNKVKLNCGDYPGTAGNYGIYKASEKVENMSFNYVRNESDLDANLLQLGDCKQASSIESVIDTWKSNQTDSDIWKWFVLLSLLFVILEVLIQKFVS